MAGSAEWNRDMGTGRYKHTNDRLCTCGHRLAIHSAARIHGEQPCFNGDPNDGDGTPCDCTSFTPAKRGKRS